MAKELERMLRRTVIEIVALPVRVYRYAISPLLPPSCRYVPSCSAYALEALAAHGVLAGLWLTLRRLLRCHPWGGSGYDPVPPVHHGPARHGSVHGSGGGCAAPHSSADHIHPPMPPLGMSK